MKPTNWDRRGRSEDWRKAQRSRWAEKGGRGERRRKRREGKQRAVSLAVQSDCGELAGRRAAPSPARPHQLCGREQSLQRGAGGGGRSEAAAGKERGLRAGGGVSERQGSQINLASVLLKIW